MKLYKMKTSLKIHMENDPLYQCKIYSVNESYNICIEKEMKVDR